MEASNNAKLRESLFEIVLLCRKVGLSIHGDVACGIIASKARAALAAPARNCDVGTAEEQYERYSQRCRAQECCDCPVRQRWDFSRTGRESCQLVWSQMPYEAR